MSQVKQKLRSFFPYALCIFFVGCAHTPRHDYYVVNYRTVVPECQGQTQREKVVCRGLGWILANPVNIPKDGFLELGEEINLFYTYYLKAKDEGVRAFYKSLIESKIDYLLREHDLKVDFAGEITAYLNFAKIMKRLDIQRPAYSEFIAREILTNPMTYPPNPTYMILNTALIEDLGEKPRIPFSTLVNQGVIARFSRNPELTPIGKAYASPDDLMNFYYDITHEVFAVGNFGDRDPTQYLLEHEIQFLKNLIPQAMSTYIDKGQVDILAELVVCARMLNYTDFYSYQKGVEYILGAQKDDGSFGIIERMAFLGRPNLYRHGVLVALWALAE